MYLKVVSESLVTLEDASNFRSFKVMVVMPSAELGMVRGALAKIAALPDRETAWVSEQALRSWQGHADDPAWQEALSRMIEKARPYGWVDDANKAIKAHVEWPTA